MSVVRIDLNKCIGCENCVNICPLDVFYFNQEAHKSIIAYPENCQSCGQCFLKLQGPVPRHQQRPVCFPHHGFSWHIHRTHEPCDHYGARRHRLIYKGQAALIRMMSYRKYADKTLTPDYAAPWCEGSAEKLSQDRLH